MNKWERNLLIVGASFSALALVISLEVASPRGHLVQVGLAAGKVILCHKSERGKKQTIKVAANKVAAHLKHGDRKGPCKVNKKKNKKKSKKSKSKGRD